MRKTSRTSNILPWRVPSPSNGSPKGAAAVPAKGRPVGAMAATAAHLPAFLQQRLRKASGWSLGFKELRAAYETWCSAHGYEPLSVPRFAGELKELGYGKWKSCGVIRYRDLQLVA